MDEFEVEQKFREQLRTAAGVAIIPASVRYRIEPFSGGQARFKGRVALHPEVNPSDYSVTAVVDWVDLAIETDRPTRRDHLSSKLAGRDVQPWAASTSGSGNGSGTSFVVRFQEPDPAALRADLDLVAKEFGLAETPRITGIEIAIDWRPNDRADQSRWLMTSVMHRHFLPEARWISGERDRPRFVYSKGKHRNTRKLYDVRWRDRFAAEAAAAGRTPSASNGGRPRSLLAGHAAPQLDGTLYHGAREANVMFRVQDKIADRRHGKAGSEIALGQGDRRTRVEVALKGEPLALAGLSAVDDLYGFRFEQEIAPYFKFWLPTISLSGDVRDTQLEIFKRSGVYGLEICEAELRSMALANGGGGSGASVKGPKGKTGTRAAFDKLKQQTYQALNRLTTKWAGFV